MPGGDYTVDKKEEIVRLVKGEVKSFLRVWATTKGGTYFHVNIAEEDWPEDKARAILTKRAKEIDAI